MAMNIPSIAINPYSEGATRRAITILNTNCIPCTEKRSTALHTTPFTACFFKESTTKLKDNYYL